MVVVERWGWWPVIVGFGIWGIFGICVGILEGERKYDRERDLLDAWLERALEGEDRLEVVRDILNGVREEKVRVVRLLEKLEHDEAVAEARFWDIRDEENRGKGT